MEYVVVASLLVSLALYLLVSRQGKVEIVIPTLIAFSGLMIHGQAVVGELILTGALAGYYFQKQKFRKATVIITKKILRLPLNVYLIVFIGMLYFLTQSIRGWIWLEDPRMIRWVITFCLVILFALFLVSETQNLNASVSINWIYYGAVAYFVLYTLAGLFAELFIGISRYDLQGVIWVGTSAAYIPLIIYFLCIVVFLSRTGDKHPAIPLLTLCHFLICANTFYYESRTAQIVTVVMSASLLFVRSSASILKKSVFFLCFCFCLVTVSNAYLFCNEQKVCLYNNLFLNKRVPIDLREANLHKRFVPQYAGGGVISAPPIMIVTDRTRVLMPLAAIAEVSKSFQTTAIGLGWYTGRFAIKDEFRDLLAKENIDFGFVNKKGSLQVTGFVEILLGTGLIGCFFIMFSVLCSIKKLCIANRVNGAIQSLALLFVFPMFFVGYPLASVLVWLVILPFTPFVLSRYQKCC